VHASHKLSSGLQGTKVGLCGSHKWCVCRGRSGIRSLKLGGTNLRVRKNTWCEVSISFGFKFLSLGGLIEIIFLWDELKFHLYIFVLRKELGLR
jgi:hypothetical protein